MSMMRAINHSNGVVTLVLTSGCSITRNVNSAGSQIDKGGTICIEMNP